MENFYHNNSFALLNITDVNSQVIDYFYLPESLNNEMEETPVEQSVAEVGTIQSTLIDPTRSQTTTVPVRSTTSAGNATSGY